MQVRDVLIVGGGIGGLTLGAALHHRGFRVEIVERNPDWRALGAGLLVQANGIRVLRSLGMDAAVAEAGMAVPRWLFADQQGQVLCETDLEALWDPVGPCIGIARAALQRVLVDCASAVPCRLGTSITSIEEHEDGVSVTFTDGSAGSFDLVVGADGIHSTVRKYAIGEVATTFGGLFAWRSIAPLELEGVPSVQFWLADQRFFGLCSIGGGQTYGFGYDVHDRQHDPLEGRLDRLRARFEDFGHTVQAYLSRLGTDEAIHCSPIEWVEQEHWHTDRVVLIGDAAHASSPMMGQGGCQAMEDAWVLAETLSAEPNMRRALPAFVARRRPRVAWVQQESRAVADSFRLPPEVRNQILRERGEAMFRHRFGPLVEAP